MKLDQFAIRVIAWALLSFNSAVAAQPVLTLEMPGMIPGSQAPDRITFCKPAPAGHITLSENRSPALRWAGAPSGTKSFAVTMYDLDVPADMTEVNKENSVIRDSAKRMKFYHWLLVDLPVATRSLEEGIDSAGVTARGKEAGSARIGRRGINDYTKFFAGDAKMSGTYAGYDGPCPPWNDQRLHRYVFSVMALDLERLALPAGFSGQDFEASVKGHVLASDSVALTYGTRASTDR